MKFRHAVRPYGDSPEPDLNAESGGSAMNLAEPGATRVDQWCVDYDDWGDCIPTVASVDEDFDSWEAD